MEFFLTNFQVNTAIIEVGIGGEYDATNIIERPTVASVSSISLDHTTVLGNTKEEIAWNKGGIFKSGVTALTVPQAPSVIKVLQRRACEKNVSSISVFKYLTTGQTFYSRRSHN